MSYEERLCEAADEGFPSDAWAVDMHTAGKIGKEADETIQHLRTQLAESEQACAAYRAALEWYAENVKGCRLIGHPGDPYRTALDKDAGDRARAALARLEGRE